MKMIRTWSLNRSTGSNDEEKRGYQGAHALTKIIVKFQIYIRI